MKVVSYTPLDEKIVPAAEQLLGLFELARNRSVSLDKLLKGTGVFAEDSEKSHSKISVLQLLELYQNSNRLFQSKESSFLLGQYLLPGLHPEFSRAILCSPTVGDALTVISSHGHIALPMLEVSYYYSDQNMYVQLITADVQDYQHEFLMEAAMGAVLSMFRWLGANTKRWQCLQAYRAPKHTEQYLVHYGQIPQFNAHINAFVIPRECLQEALPRGSQAQYDLALKACVSSCQASNSAGGRSLSLETYQQLQADISRPPSLEALALNFGLSPATYKRYLKREGSSYQQLLDSARRHLAVYYLHSGLLNTEQIAEKLKYHDKHNFKRSFKRWTGCSPASYFSR